MRRTSVVGAFVIGLGIVLGSVLADLPAFAQERHPVTLRARVVDAVCLLTSGLKGEMHRECAFGCDKAGVRMYLLDEHANVLYGVMADGPFKDPNAPLRPFFERLVVVRGDLYVGPGGHKVIAIREVHPQQHQQ